MWFQAKLSEIFYEFDKNLINISQLLVFGLDGIVPVLLLFQFFYFLTIRLNVCHGVLASPPSSAVFS
ncbi:hypothetical protein J2X69_003237 [Algoriphagus sp. 4150]|nr:hypothetical protein [Algoriphagus sp. 4150]